ncbi:lipopolysaccharide biosynthesis protein BplA [Vibrio anguillarum]|uniref:lipopolysaccharide biosynthesis protein BplA n=1 Tax=Vibrio anguillarum TaxID=55601 RepID=UPI00097E2D61|nr:lipopolysaccharide biosynthesis protein BplA [Vibrio anguillarum]MBT2909448.1 lipopolysaccharide biosynthesis protein BplA [Vibrio anguillarum]MBT2942526.1 lipopolysaccharide biosynthesis protein BplA [Vibrio anguillarum]MBT2950650.1 lipopolysaccharide biosynthesis protein BplA [Vibrio anguillarum]MBT2979560.1 lipopolysaccharide biosynthesis protein BplA [Vibrio anguillarum]
MTNFANKAEALASFIDIVRKKTTLEPLADSQVMQGINVFQNLTLEYALHALERANQEGYLSTAYNRSSILALAEDRSYLPRKATPSRGSFKIRNKGQRDRSVMAQFPIVSEDQVYYMVNESVRVAAGSEIVVDGCQLKLQELMFTVEKEQPFIEFELGRSMSVNIHKFQVFVDMGSGYEEWKPTNRFRNAKADKVFDEFYSHTDQVGIRFGNNIFGLIPRKDSKIKVQLWLTEGDTKLMPKQTLTPVDENFDELEFETESVFTGGTAREETEELRRNALYYPLYDDNHVWDDDYLFFIKQHFPEVIWGNVWGEAEQEKMDGELKLESVNKIFVCVYAPENPAIGQEIEAHMTKHIPQFNRRYQNVPVDARSFIAKITGKLLRNVSLSDAQKLISDSLWNNYGKDTRKRKPKALKRDLYKLMNGLNIFEGEDDIEMEIIGQAESENLKQMIYIDLEGSMNALSIDYTSSAKMNIY